MKRNTLAALLLSSLTATVAPAQNVQQIHSDYEARQAEFGDCGVALCVENTAADEETRRALEFLYAYMPWPDVAALQSGVSPRPNRVRPACTPRNALGQNSA